MEEFSRLGVEEVVVACINCHKVFVENSSMKIRTIYELMTEKGFPRSVSGQGRKVSIHDVCPARYTPGIRRAVREIVTQLDYEIAEMTFRNEVTNCCGAGGCAPCGRPFRQAFTKTRGPGKGPGGHLLRALQGAYLVLCLFPACAGPGIQGSGKATQQEVQQELEKLAEPLVPEEQAAGYVLM